MFCSCVIVLVFLLSSCLPFVVSCCYCLLLLSLLPFIVFQLCDIDDQLFNVGLANNTIGHRCTIAVSWSSMTSVNEKRSKTTKKRNNNNSTQNDTCSVERLVYKLKDCWLFLIKTREIIESFNRIQFQNRHQRIEYEKVMTSQIKSKQITKTKHPKNKTKTYFNNPYMHDVNVAQCWQCWSQL